MATIQVENVSMITVDRTIRDVLRTCLRSEAYRLEDFERLISGSDAQAAHGALDRAAHLVEMFDQLGWTADDPREHYEITVVRDSFVQWLRGHRDDLAQSLADEMMLLPRIAEGVESHYWGHSRQAMFAMTRSELLRARKELKAIEALLKRLDSAAAEAASRP